MIKYISKEEGWYDTGTESTLLFEITDGLGMFKGIKDGELDEEPCSYDEFEIIEDEE